MCLPVIVTSSAAIALDVPKSDILAAENSVTRLKIWAIMVSNFSYPSTGWEKGEQKIPVVGLKITVKNTSLVLHIALVQVLAPMQVSHPARDVDS